MDYKKLREEPLKSAVREDFFKAYKYTQIGNIDFVVAKHITEKGQASLFEDVENDNLKSLLWAEAKQGTSHDIYESFVQLILTIGKEKTFEKYLPPKYIGAFDAEKFAFIEYHKIQGVFYQNDFNWNVTPSNHDSKEFKQIYELCKNLLSENSIIFRYETQSGELKEFIKLNFKADKDVSEKISVTKNNFTFVFQKWQEKVKPSIAVDWEMAKKIGIIAADFFLADLLSSENESLKDNLYVVLHKTKYELAKKIDDLGFESSKTVGFNDKQKAYKEFWAIYARPPKEEYWEYIIGRRDLLVPQDIRERKGSFFTPQIWVEKSQEYLADVLGETWQDEYFVWDCCAGTGNLLNGLTNYRNVWASTLDKQDVDVMKDRIKNGWKMFENHVFQFDFLNDDFLPQNPEAVVEPVETTKNGNRIAKGKIPDDLYEILTDAEKRKRLVIYINPPYAEAGNKRTITGKGENRTGLSETKIRSRYKDKYGSAVNELFAQFLIRIYEEIQCCKLAQFATLKALCAPNFAKFRNVFQARLEKSFIVPAKTFDNVKGEFPIGFFVWDLAEKEIFTETKADAYDEKGNPLSKKTIFAVSDKIVINDWLRQYFDKTSDSIGIMHNNKNDFQHNNQVCITSTDNHDHTTPITKNNLIEMCIYLAVRHCIEATWLNDRDQFLFPNDGWKTDFEFQVDCLIYTLFSGQNRISCEEGINHWIPFTEEQVGCKKAFKSNFMSGFLRDFLDGKEMLNVVLTGSTTAEGSLFDEEMLNQVQHDIKQQVQHDGEEMIKVVSAGSTTAEKGGVETEFASQTSQGDLPPLEGVADKPTKRSESSCLQERFVERLGLGARGRLSPPKNFSKEAQAVYDAGLELWKYYHTQGKAADASFYDIRKFFQGETKGRMNNGSDDEKYTELILDLREKMKALAKQIERKVYEFGFLK